MDPVRWRRIEELYHAALARPAADRAPFLAEACAGDEAFRQEVQTLLDTPATADGVFAAPVPAITAAAHVEPPPLTGRQLGVYRLQERIGAGGMGEVYRARDTRLGRDVAIKVLPASFAADPDRLARFEREARILAALNHPHIAAIYGLEDTDGRQALVLELVDGPSLAERLAKGPFAIKAALDLARQIADALESAHEHGIVHRDLKPANIKLTPDGVVKVLDFGLAKAFAGDGDGLDLSQMPTLTVDLTRPGVLAGTPAYMSPEQARGQTVDKRTDIWGFGCVLYEMLTGRPAFPGETISDTIAAVLDREPDWDVLPEKMPRTVRRLLQRCLEKDGRRRLRDITAAHFVIEDSTAENERTGATLPAANRSRRLAVAVGTVLIVAAGAGIAWWVGRQSIAPADNLLEGAQFTRFTDFPGDERSASISPDGRFVAFLSDRDGPFDIWLSQVGSGRFTKLTLAPGDDVPNNRELGFSPDGSEIWLAGGPPDRRLRLMPLLGGNGRVFLQGNALNVGWSPDGALVAYNTADEPGDPMFVADRAGANARQIHINPLPVGHNHFPVWSSDGRWIYFVSGIASTGEMDLWRIAPSGGTPERLTHHNTDVTYPTPIRSDMALYLSRAEDGSGPWLWILDTNRRAMRRASYGLEKYTSLAASADGRRLVATVSQPHGESVECPDSRSDG